MTEQNGILYVFTSREGYIDEMYGRGHQGMMLISLNEKTMETKIVEANLNHSFTQFIDSDEKWLYLYEESEGKRATILSRLQPETAGSYKKIPVLKYGGQRTSVWSIPTYAYADDVAVSDHSVLGVGYSIDQSMYDNANKSRYNIYNIYLSVTPKDSFTEADTKLIWLTDYKEKFNAFFNLSLAKVNDNRFMVMWEEVERIEKRVKRVSYDPSNPNDPFSGGKLHYLFVDSNGNKVSKEFTASASASQCKPILNDSKMIYCASVGGAVCFYTINAETGELNKKIFRVAGEQISWKMEGNTLTFSGKGALTLKPYGYLGVQKVVIRDGITEIGSGVFLNTRPYDVVIPPSVTKIADDAFTESGPWSERRILGYKGTYAETFANKKEDLTFVPVILGDTDLDEKVTIVDVTCIQRHLADLSTDSFGEMVADTDEDGKVTILDATAIQRHLASMPTNQNIGKPMG